MRFCSNDEHSLNAPSSIDSTEEGIEICVNDLHSLKTRFFDR